MVKLIKQPHGGAIQHFEKGESGNPNGRPKKGISLVNDKLLEEGYTPATKQDIEANYMSMIQLSQERLTELAKDKEQPMLIRILAENMLSHKGFDIIEKMLDRGIGKATQKEEINHTGEISVSQILKDIQGMK